jgi:hypothetical protein
MVPMFALSTDSSILPGKNLVGMGVEPPPPPGVAPGLQDMRKANPLSIRHLAGKEAARWRKSWVNGCPTVSRALLGCGIEIGRKPVSRLGKANETSWTFVLTRG